MYCVTAANGFGAEVQDVREKLEEVTQATNIREAMNLLLQAKMMLDKEVGKLGRISKLRFLGDVYGLNAVGWGVLCLIIFAVTLLWQPISDVFSGTELYGVPVWAGLFAGIGASVQILVEVVGDVRDLGYVATHRNLTYLTLPFIADVFGFIIYALAQCGVMYFGGGSFTGYLGYVICFLAGYATDWFMSLLKDLTNAIKMSTTVR